jgi:hypothetical protein
MQPVSKGGRARLAWGEVVFIPVKKTVTPDGTQRQQAVDGCFDVFPLLFLRGSGRQRRGVHDLDEQDIVILVDRLSPVRVVDVA